MTGPRAMQRRKPTAWWRRAIVAPLAATLAACETFAPPPPPPAPPTASIAALYLQPAERSLVDGIRLYEEASFDRAEAALRQALAGGLDDPRDRAVAYKYIAFIACAFERIAECEESFRSAFAADPQFALGEKEVGHPVWGPVYRRIAAAQPRQ
jgi:tetratricopeptide (TPR) repeat protein